MFTLRRERRYPTRYPARAQRGESVLCRGGRKRLLHDQAAVALNLVDPFADAVPYRSETVAASFTEQTEYRACQWAFFTGKKWERPGERKTKKRAGSGAVGIGKIPLPRLPAHYLILGINS